LLLLLLLVVSQVRVMKTTAEQRRELEMKNTQEDEKR